MILCKVTAEPGQGRRIQRKLVVDLEIVGQRIDKALSFRFNDLSRSQLAKWIRQGEVRLNGDTVRATKKVELGDIVEISAELPLLMDWSGAADIEVPIVFEDDSVIVVDKPAGLVVHPGAGNPRATLVNGLLDIRPSLASLPRAGIVHRLDKDTSGLLVVAASEYARQRLIEQLTARTMKRVYQCVLEGRMEYPKRAEMPIRRNPTDRTKQQASRLGREARTDFKPIEVFRVHTHVEAHLHTGRTHQIRVHASALGLPLVGDKRYGAKARLPKMATQQLVEAITRFDRQALHAGNLTFEHPCTQEEMEFESPLPSDMMELLKVLQANEHD